MPLSAFPTEGQSSQLLRRPIKPALSVLWNETCSVCLVWKEQHGSFREHQIQTWTGSTDPTSFYSALHSHESFIVLQILKGLRCLRIGTSSPLFLSLCCIAECLEDDTRWAPAASACGVYLERIATPFEGSGGVFVPVLYIVGWEETHAARSDGVYHWQAEWWALNRLRNMTDLQRQCWISCQFSHIHEAISMRCLPQPAFFVYGSKLLC